MPARARERAPPIAAWPENAKYDQSIRLAPVAKHASGGKVGRRVSCACHELRAVASNCNLARDAHEEPHARTNVWLALVAALARGGSVDNG